MSPATCTPCVRTFRDGDDLGWDAEFEFLRVHHEARVQTLAALIVADGITNPILLGHDGRVWDGHHRLYVAKALGLTHVPASLAPVEGDDSDQSDDGPLALWRCTYTEEGRDCDGVYFLPAVYVLAPHEDEAWNRSYPHLKIPEGCHSTGVHEARTATGDEASEWLAQLANQSIAMEA